MMTMGFHPLEKMEKTKSHLNEYGERIPYCAKIGKNRTASKRKGYEQIGHFKRIDNRPDFDGKDVNW